jgi:glyoxylate reductase
MATIVITQRLIDGSLALFEGTGHRIVSLDADGPLSEPELMDAVRDADALICLLNDQVTASVIEVGTSLKVIATVSVGVDNIDVAAARLRGIAVVNTPGVLDEATADIAMLLMGSALRRTTEAEHALRSGHWQGWSLDGFLGRDLTGATLGLVGYGRIARCVATRAAGFSMEVLHHTRTATGIDGWCDSLAAMAGRVDVLSVHVPWTKETTDLVDGPIFSAMPKTSVMVNTARGPIVNERALLDALFDGEIWGAGLDVYLDEPRVNPELLSAPHVVLYPHIGSSTGSTRLAMCRLAITGTLDVLAGRTPSNAV